MVGEKESPNVKYKSHNCYAPMFGQRKSSPFEQQAQDHKIS